jgi:oligogalacturonide lyase
VADDAFQGVLETVSLDRDGLAVIEGTVVGTGVGDLAHYLARPRQPNEHHGIGAFLIMHEQRALAVGVAVVPSAAASDVGRRFPPERRVLVDRATGASLTALTTADADDTKIYQSHPQWTADGLHVVFRSSGRSRDGRAQLFAVHELTGEIVQLTDGPGVTTRADSLALARRANKLYHLRDQDGRAHLVELDLDRLLPAGSLADGQDAARERVVAVLPPDHRGEGGLTLDASEKVAYLGVNLQDPPPREPGKPLPQVPGGIRAVDLATGAYTKVVDTPFRVGHVQANPWVPGEILYCNETGGDAPQRMWVVRADGSGNRPLFEEEPKDAVTHEVFVDRDHVMFNLLGGWPGQRARPTGIMVVGLRDGFVEPVGQAPGPGFLHNNGTADGRWAAGDNFDGALYLIDRRSGERRLLTAGHSGHLHQSFSPDGTRVLFQSGLLSGGKSLDLFVVPVSGTIALPR